MHCIFECHNFVQLAIDLFISHTQIILDVTDLQLFITDLQLSSVTSSVIANKFQISSNSIYFLDLLLKFS